MAAKYILYDIYIYTRVCNMKIVPDDYSKARWLFQIFVLFSPLFGKDFQFDEHIFQMGW